VPSVHSSNPAAFDSSHITPITGLVAAPALAAVAVAGAAPVAAAAVPRAGARAVASAVARAGVAGQEVLQLPRDGHHMPEVAEASLAALPHLELAAGGLPEVCDWAEVDVDGAVHVPAVVEVLGSLDCVFLLPELDVHIAPQVIALIVAHAHLFNLSVLLLTLHKHILKEVLKLLLDLVVTDVAQVRPIC